MTYQKIIGPFAPNQKVVLKFHIPYKVTINSMGLRGEDFSIKKSPDTYRILCLGDSLAFGFGISKEEQLFTSVLAKELNTIGKKKKFEVINAGIGGTTITDQYAFLQKKCLKTTPDLVILTFCSNDIDELANLGAFNNIETYIAQKTGILALAEKSNTYKLMADIYKLLVVLSKALHRRLSLKKKTIYKKFNALFPRKQNNQNVSNANNIKAIGLEVEEEKQKLLWNKYKECLSKMYTELKRDNIKFVFAIKPIDKGQQIILHQYAKELNIPLIDYSPIFNDDNPKENPSFAPVDYHPSPYGHRMMAIYLRNFLTTNIIN